MTEDALFGILGKPLDSQEVTDFLAKHPSFKLGRARAGRQYAVSLELGVDLLFEPDDEGRGGRSRRPRRCQHVFLHARDHEDHQQYQGSLPWGFAFEDSRDALMQKATPERTWKQGEGEVERDHPAPSSDRWRYGEHHVTAQYDPETGRARFFLVGRLLG